MPSEGQKWSEGHTCNELERLGNKLLIIFFSHFCFSVCYLLFYDFVGDFVEVQLALVMLLVVKTKWSFPESH